MKLNKIKIFLMVALGIVLITSLASAHGKPPTQIVTCGSSTTPACSLCEIWHLADHIINFLLFALALPILVIAILVGGIVWLFSAGNPKNITLGKSIITSALIGVLIAFAGWLIVDSIIKTLAEGKPVAAWKEIGACPPAPTAPTPPPGPPPPPVGPPPPSPGGTFQTEDEGKAFFQNAGIGIVSTGNCSDPTRADCTSVVGLPQSTANHLSGLHLTSGLNFVISGGTETGHLEHGSGQPVVDLQPSGSTTFSQIQSQVRVLGGQAYCENQGGTQRIESCGGATNHVHVAWP